jgi:hypothetical protein
MTVATAALVDQVATMTVATAALVDLVVRVATAALVADAPGMKMAKRTTAAGMTVALANLLDQTDPRPRSLFPP